MKIKNIITTLVFAAFLFTMSFLCIINPADVFSHSERRELASFPDFSVEALFSGDFTKDFETYTTERFAYRDTFRTIKAWFATNVLRQLDNNGIFVADGHISRLDGDMNEKMMDYAAERFAYINSKYLSDKNINLYFCAVPDKNFVISAKNGYPSIDYAQFIDKMKQKTDYMQYIDITDLLDADDYYTTDTHWRQEKITDIARSIAQAMGVDVTAQYTENTLDNPFYGVYSSQSALPIEADTIKYLTNDTINKCIVTYYDTGKPKAGDMYNMKKAYGKDPYEMFLSGTSPLITIENPNAKTDRELYLFRDSYGSSIAPLLAQGYKKITVIDIRYVQSDFLGTFVEFLPDSDALFLYSTTLLNNSTSMR